jgi:hypothetical protein
VVRRPTQTSITLQSVIWNKGIGFARKSAEAFIECGDNLLAAKAAMDPDAFTAMIRVGLPFDETKACRLMQIAQTRLFARM